MGFDVYSYIMVGVQANKVIEEKEIVKEVTRYDTYTGKPYVLSVIENVYKVGDKDFDKDSSDYNEYIEKNDLELVCFDEFGYDQDTIGLIVCDNSNEGGRKEACTIEELKIKLNEVRKLLQKIGIMEEPEVRLVIMISY